VSEVMIEARGLFLGYTVGGKRVEVLRGIDLKILPGEKVFLCGPSGAGKTTLMYTLAGLERPEQGEILYNGKNFYDLGRNAQAKIRNARIGYVFQNYFLLPELTALENVLVPAAIGGKDGEAAARLALERVGLSERADHLPAELSGGEQQRVAIARAIVNKPDIIFADEPTGNLDSRKGEEIMRILTELTGDHGMALVVVTHDEHLAETGDRMLIIRDGVIVGEEQQLAAG
jgi:ABC-type lipoprotein export system ATPase subunit